MPVSDFGDLVPKNVYDTNRKEITIDRLIGRKFTVLEYTPYINHFDDESKAKVAIDIMLDDNRYVLFTGSTVIIKQINMVDGKFPFTATIRKKKSKMGRRYYELASAKNKEE